MSKKLQKSLQDYLSKIKKPSPNVQFPSNSVSSSKKWILKGCKHPKTLSFAVTRDGNGQGISDNDDAATLSDVDRFLFENFRSWYIKGDEDEDEDEEIHERRGRIREEDHDQAKSPRGILFESPRFVDLPHDLCGSNRFFVATGLSSSLIEEARSSGVTKTTMSTSTEESGSSSTSTSNESNTTTANDSNGGGGGGSDDHVIKSSPSVPNECIAVLTYSPNPYDDFQRSMQEMVDARLKNHSTIDWDFMEELLFCYLNLNDKKSYKFILSAFVDLIVALRQNEYRKIPVRSRNSKVVRDKRSRRTRHA